MTLTDIRNILEIGESTGIPIILHGAEGRGKTAFCRQLFPHSRIILNEEIASNGLSIINSLAKTAKTLIFENLSEENLNKILPIIINRSLYGETLDNAFIFTSRSDYRIVEGFIKVLFPVPSAVEWLAWAKTSAIHPIVLRMVEEKTALQILKPRELENLSRLLNAGIPGELLEALALPLIGNHPEFLEMIQEGYNDTIDFEKVISLDNREFINRIKQTSSKNIERFNEELLKEIRFDESIITKEKLISYITSMDSRKSLELLSGLLESESSFEYLNELLEDRTIRTKIDAMIRI